MKKIYLLVGSDSLGSGGQAVYFAFSQSKKEKIWKQKISERFPDEEFETIWLADLLKLSAQEVIRIYAYPQTKPFLSLVKEKFPDVKLEMVDSLE
ncbi:MAG: hypothetical protein LBV67_05835 [Streptococcaceae bacterium]|jgi:hypothetical protein|nr:hypothetical protein [Streptococcaceae bacterium]